MREGYRTGRGRVIMRARTHFEEAEKGGRSNIVIDELPYQVNKATLLMKIGELVREKKIEGISDIRDESDKSGMRAVIELKRGDRSAATISGEPCPGETRMNGFLFERGQDVKRIEGGNGSCYSSLGKKRLRIRVRYSNLADYEQPHSETC